MHTERWSGNSAAGDVCCSSVHQVQTFVMMDD